MGYPTNSGTKNASPAGVKVGLNTLGSDARRIDSLLFHVWRRCNCKTVAADAWFNTEKNHRIARDEINVTLIIPATGWSTIKEVKKRTLTPFPFAFSVP